MPRSFIQMKDAVKSTWIDAAFMTVKKQVLKYSWEWFSSWILINYVNNNCDKHISLCLLTQTNIWPHDSKVHFGLHLVKISLLHC